MLAKTSYNFLIVGATSKAGWPT